MNHKKKPAAFFSESTCCDINLLVSMIIADTFQLLCFILLQKWKISMFLKKRRQTPLHQYVYSPCYYTAALIILPDLILVLHQCKFNCMTDLYYSLGNHTAAKTIISMYHSRKWQLTLSQKLKIYQVNNRVCINIIWCEIQIRPVGCKTRHL